MLDNGCSMTYDERCLGRYNEVKGFIEKIIGIRRSITHKEADGPFLKTREEVDGCRRNA